ncbi:DUF2169 domain-containing protein [Chondromyces crocatus]|uniref:DUF2169 domain-containing protein n=1 Tax=Chondromyces crocatus TaxID=52 RepID=A0A0K1EBE2_CHOCO|nr:DUF2169 domain-containing protein [Chondromyces crocatus]AKT38164.1 uncharacterized protein CMC5_023070 [Chondromyces crocatus]
MVARIIWGQPEIEGGVRLSSGVMRSRSPTGGAARDSIVLVAKAALQFPPEGEEALLIPPPPLSLDVLSSLSGATESELAYASDFVPGKPSVEVLVTGHAYAEEAAHRIDASLGVGAMHRSFTLVASGPATRLPLSSAYLRDTDGKRTTAPVGPIRPPPRSGAREPLNPDAHSYASPSQRLDTIPPDAALELVGLSPRARRRVIRLPDLTPMAIAVSRFGDDIPISLTCDTLWIHTDEERLVLVWRGPIPLPPTTDPATIERIDLWLARAGEPVDVDSVRRRLQRGVFAFAVEEADVIEGRAPPPIPPEQLAAVRYALWEESPEPALPLEAYARISAELMEKRESRADVLLHHQLDEDAWTVEERAWLEWMGAAAMRGDAQPAKEYGDLFLEAQEALAGPDEAARTIDDYVPIKAAMDRGADPTKVLAAFTMTLPEWLRLDRRFSTLAASDAALRAEIEAKSRATSVDPRLLDEDESSDEDDEDEDEDDDDDGHDARGDEHDDAGERREGELEETP